MLLMQQDMKVRAAPHFHRGSGTIVHLCNQQVSDSRFYMLRIALAEQLQIVLQFKTELPCAFCKDFGGRQLAKIYLILRMRLTITVAQ